MSSRGENIPEVATVLRNIAARISSGSATANDEEALLKLAAAFAGEDKKAQFKIHWKRGRPAKGTHGVDRRYQMAIQVHQYMAEHGCAVGTATEALDGFDNIGAETLARAWQEFGPLIDADPPTRDTVLAFKKLEARGLAKVTLKRGPRGAS